eukprot:1538335-Prorocentrum_lima.AAC.1
MNKQNQHNFRGCTMSTLENKGVYPLTANHWWLAHPAGRAVTSDAITSSNKDCRYWYCACCGG